MSLWIVFAFLCVILAKEWGLPLLIGQAIQATLVLLLLLVLLGVFSK